MKLWNGELKFIKTRDKPKLTDQCTEGHGFDSRRGLRFYSDFTLMIPIGDSDFFFVPRSQEVEYPIFLISSPSLKSTIFLYLSPIGHCNIADPSSMQDACHHELSKYDLCLPRVSH